MGQTLSYLRLLNSYQKAALDFIQLASTKESNESCRRQIDQDPLTNLCLSYTFYKSSNIHSFKSFTSGENRWKIVGNSNFFRSAVEKVPYEDVIKRKGYEKLKLLYFQCKTHAEPRLLNSILTTLILRGGMVRDLDFIYLHTGFSPCNKCNQAGFRTLQPSF